jgi:hypothetical protein
MRAITGNRFNSPHTIARVQARHLLRILKERYTCGVKGDLANGWIMISPDELAEMEKEIEG